MLILAIVGLVANLAAMDVLHGSHDLNVKSSFLHVLSDTLSSVAGSLQRSGLRIPARPFLTRSSVLRLPP